MENGIQQSNSMDFFRIAEVAIHYLDWVLERQYIPQDQLQLYSVTALLVAFKVRFVSK